LSAKTRLAVRLGKACKEAPEPVLTLQTLLFQAIAFRVRSTFFATLTQHFGAGKLSITAKNAFAVKHLHHKPLILGGLDGGGECVDNCDPPTVRMLILAAYRRRYPQ